MTDHEILTLEEVAQYLRLKPQTIYKWAQEKRIPAVKLGKEWRFRRSILDRWLDEQIDGGGLRITEGVALGEVTALDLTPAKIAGLVALGLLHHDPLRLRPTPSGRLVLDRLTDGGVLDPAGQALFDRFCQDMDDNLREMGISDLKVPKEMKLMGQAFYGRSKAYLDAVSDRRALVAALTRNIYGGAPSAAAAAPRLADYIGQAVGDLKAQDRAAIIDGRLRFPDPAAVPTPTV